MTIDERATMANISERASSCLVMMGGMTTGDDARMMIMRHMKALVEDCAKIVAHQAEGFQVLVERAPTPARAEEMKRCKHSMEITAAEIRKLADVPENPGPAPDAGEEVNKHAYRISTGRPGVDNQNPSPRHGGRRRNPGKR